MLIWALFAFVVLSGFATVALKSSGSERRLSKAASEWNQSFYAAEAGLEAAIQVTPDSVLAALAPGDSLDLGWRSLGGAIDYRAVFHRIDAGGLQLFLLTSTGRKPGLFGGETSVNLAFTTLSDPTGTITFDQDVTVSGRAEVLGACRLHTNQRLMVPGELVSNGPVTASGSIDGNVRTSGNESMYPVDSDLAAMGMTDGSGGSSGSVEQYADYESVDPPPPDHLSRAVDFNVGVNGVGRAGSTAAFGTGHASNWRYVGNGEFEITGPIEPGTYFVDGSVEFEQATVGAPGAPQSVTLLASGYIESDESTLYLKAAHPEGVLFAARGDVEIDITTGSFEGSIYTRAHCEVTGASNITLDGALVCRGEPEPSGVPNLADENRFEGDIRFITECSETTESVSARRLTERAWWRQY